MNSQMPSEMTDAIPNARQRAMVRNSNPKPRRVATNKKADNVANIAPHTPVAISRIVFRITSLRFTFRARYAFTSVPGLGVTPMLDYPVY
jgi:hypothetical protein